MAGPNDPGTTSTAGVMAFTPYNRNELLGRAYGNGNAQANYGQSPGQETQVWMGKGYERRGLPKRGGGDNGMRPISVAAREYWSWGAEELAKWGEYSQAVNGFVPGEFQAEGLLQNMLMGLAQYQTTSGEKIDMWQYMERRKELALQAKQAKGGGGGGGARAIVNLTNPQDAEVLVDNALTQYLGRQATQEELDKFLRTLNRAERRNPVIASTSGQSGGINQQLMAQEFATSRPEAGETQAATTYMGWMMDALTQPVAGGIESGL